VVKNGKSPCLDACGVERYRLKGEKLSDPEIISNKICLPRQLGYAATYITDAINEAVTLMREDGRMEGIRTKYLVPYVDDKDASDSCVEDTEYDIFLLIFTFCVMVGFFILLAVYKRRRKFKRHGTRLLRAIDLSESAREMHLHRVQRLAMLWLAKTRQSARVRALAWSPPVQCQKPTGPRYFGRRSLGPRSVAMPVASALERSSSRARKSVTRLHFYTRHIVLERFLSRHAIGQVRELVQPHRTARRS